MIGAKEKLVISSFLICRPSRECLYRVPRRTDHQFLDALGIRKMLLSRHHEAGDNKQHKRSHLGTSSQWRVSTFFFFL